MPHDLRPSPLGRHAARPDGSLGIATPTKRLLAQARAIANSLDHKCPRTEHILLAATSPKLQSPAATLLAECGANPDGVRDRISRTLLQQAPELAGRLQRKRFGSIRFIGM